jgi:ABC-2 type transport system permease protein
MRFILAKEFNSFLNSLIAYIVIGVFLIVTGLLLWFFPDTSLLDYGYADLSVFFSSVPYILMFLIPAIAMRSFAEEQRTGTLELLLTKPLSDWDIVVGKFLAVWLLVVVALLPTVIYYVSLYQLGSPPGNIDTAGVVGSYLGLLLLAAAFCSIGVMASSLTSNQIVAFLVGAFLCFILYDGFNNLADINTWTEFSFVIKRVGMVYHYDALRRGVIDSRDVIYFLSLVFILLLFTRTTLASRSW